MNLTREEIIKEIYDRSEIGKEMFKIELSYYKNLVIAVSTGLEERGNE